MDEDNLDENMDLSIGGIPLGVFMKAMLSGSKTSFIISIAALAVSVGSLAIAIISLVKTCP